MELQGRLDEIRRQGLGLAAISYDAPETLKTFAASRGITFPLLSDAGSEVIRRYGILNTEPAPQSRTYGIPHPGTFIVARDGTVTSRYFETAYQERYTAATILTAEGIDVAGPRIGASTAQLTMRATIPDASVAPGERVSLVIDVTPLPRMHVYAPGRHSYQVVRVTIDPQPWLRVHPTVYPAAGIYHFAPLDERVEVYSEPFRLVTDLTIVATPEVQKSLAPMSSVTITGALEYQACDDRLCYNPARIPLSFTLATKPLERSP